MPVIDPLPEEAVDEEIRELDEYMRQYTGAPGMTPYVNAAARYPALLEQMADEHLTVMPSDELRRETKETMAVAVSMINACDYCVGAHTTLLRTMFDRSNRDVVEIAAAAAHATGLARMERAMEGAPFTPVDPSDEDVPEESVEALAAVEAALDRRPVHFALAARDPDYCRELLARERIRILEGDLDRRTKEYVVLAAAWTIGAPRLARDRMDVLAAMGESEAALFEGFQAVEIFQVNNVWTSGLGLERGLWADE